MELQSFSVMPMQVFGIGSSLKDRTKTSCVSHYRPDIFGYIPPRRDCSIQLRLVVIPFSNFLESSTLFLPKWDLPRSFFQKPFDIERNSSVYVKRNIEKADYETAQKIKKAETAGKTRLNQPSGTNIRNPEPDVNKKLSGRDPTADATRANDYKNNLFRMVIRSLLELLRKFGGI